MLLLSIPVAEDCPWSLQQASSLLKDQGLEIASPARFSDAIQDAIALGADSLELAPPQLNFMIQTLQALDAHTDERLLTLPKVTTVFEARMAGRARNWLGRKRPDEAVAQRLFDFLRIADLLDVQFKIRTIFCGRLSARKVGRAGARKVNVLANPDNQYTMVNKIANFKLGQSDRDGRDSIATSLPSTASSTDSFSTGACLNVSAEEGRALDNRLGGIKKSRLNGSQLNLVSRVRSGSNATKIWRLPAERLTDSDSRVGAQVGNCRRAAEEGKI